MKKYVTIIATLLGLVACGLVATSCSSTQDTFDSNRQVGSPNHR